MLLTPTYAENIIVGILKHDGFKWYVTPADEWFLDFNKYCDMFSRAGYPLDKEWHLSFRKGIEVIDETTIDDFLTLEKEYEVSSSELQKMIADGTYSEISAMIPSLFIDFIHKRLYSLFPETIRYEAFVPDGWIGQYDDFLNLIPARERYWMKDGVHILDELLMKEDEDNN